MERLCLSLSLFVRYTWKMLDRPLQCKAPSADSPAACLSLTMPRLRSLPSHTIQETPFPRPSPSPNLFDPVTRLTSRRGALLQSLIASTTAELQNLSTKTERRRFCSESKGVSRIAVPNEPRRTFRSIDTSQRAITMPPIRHICRLERVMRRGREKGGNNNAEETIRATHKKRRQSPNLSAKIRILHVGINTYPSCSARTANCLVA